MTALTLIITDAGRAAIVNAQNTGAGPVVLSQIALGSATYASPSASQLALLAEVKRLSTFGADVVADNIIHITITDTSADTYTLGEFGIYTDSGVLFAVYSQATPILEKGAEQLVMLSADILITSVQPGSVTIGGAEFMLPAATTERQGIVELATTSETVAGADAERAVTPAALAALTATPERRGLVELLTPLEAIALADDQRALTATALEAALGNILCGMVADFPMTSAPSGWLKANGAAVSRTTYARLFARIGTRFGAGDGSTTFNLPDERGNFRRGWDDGRGIDPDRVLGSLQNSDNKSHSHTTNSAGDHSHSVADPGHSHTTTAASYSRGSYQYAPGEAGHYPGWAPGTATGGAATGISIANAGAHTHTISSNGGSESRPRNTAYLTCIKY